MSPVWSSFLKISLLLFIFASKITNIYGITSIENAENDTMREGGILNLKHEEKDSEEDDDSEQLDEPPDYGNREKFMDETLDRLLWPGSKPENPSVIDSSFNSRKTFSCPRIKTDLKTGTSIGDLSPEDIGIIAAMGDALSTGSGLWPRTNIEFRGASFASGGDATIDGLVTIPNILREFNPDLVGVSHGMGTKDQLPEHQLNVAESGANMKDLPAQARELVRRLEILGEVEYTHEWVMVIITIGTEEVCSSCIGAEIEPIKDAIDILQMGIPKAFVVLLGPLHVSPMKHQTENWLSKRCSCLEKNADHVAQNWTKAFKEIQNYVEYNVFRGPTFGLLALPSLTITSRFPASLFLPRSPLLNRRGHMYATKWLWNRLIAGSKYNLSEAILSQDTYFCPSTGCPYFRTFANRKGCQLLSLSEAKEKEIQLGPGGKVYKTPRRTRKRLYTIALIIVCVAFVVVFVFGTIFYQRSKQGDHGRFEVVQKAQLKFEEAKKEEERALLHRQSTRALSTEVLGEKVPRAMSFRSNRLQLSESDS